jgi:hypothetical protein
MDLSNPNGAAMEMILPQGQGCLKPLANHPIRDRNATT